MAVTNTLISLEEAKTLVKHLESGETEQANEIIQSAVIENSTELFREVGKLTRELHNSLANFQIDGRIAGLMDDKIPDAKSRLEYVIKESEKAANSTIDAVESSMPIADQLNERLLKIMPEWKKLMSRQIELGEFKSLCLDLDGLLLDASRDSERLNQKLTDVLMAQGSQDLTGQVIGRVIELVTDVEENLVDLLASFGTADVSNDDTQTAKNQDDKCKAEGPIINAQKRDDVVNNQDDVDDLLSSLGF